MTDKVVSGDDDARENARETDSGDDEIRFGDAMTELRSILSRLDGDDVDLDDLSGLVERAANLIRLCRKRILKTEMRIEEIITDLDRDLEAENVDESAERAPEDAPPDDAARPEDASSASGA